LTIGRIGGGRVAFPTADASVHAVGRSGNSIHGHGHGGAFAVSFLTPRQPARRLFLGGLVAVARSIHDERELVLEGQIVDGIPHRLIKSPSCTQAEPRNDAHLDALHPSSRALELAAQGDHCVAHATSPFDALQVPRWWDL